MKKTLSKHLYCKIWHYLIVSAPSNHTYQSTQGTSPCSQNLDQKKNNKKILLYSECKIPTLEPLQQQVFSKPNKLVSKLTNIGELPTLKISEQLHGEGYNSKLSQCIYASPNLPVG